MTPTPVRFWVWALAFAVDLATPFAVRKIQAAAPLDVGQHCSRVRGSNIVREAITSNTAQKLLVRRQQRDFATRQEVLLPSEPPFEEGAIRP